MLTHTQWSCKILYIGLIKKILIVCFYVFSDCFSVNVWSRLITAVQLIIIISFGLSVSPPALLYNVDTIFWLQNLISAVISLLLVLLSSSNSLAEYLSLACKTYTLPSSPLAHPFPVSLFITLLFYPFLPILYSVTWLYIDETDIFYNIRYYYIYIPVSAVEVAISVCCFIATRAFKDVNYRLKMCFELKFEPSTLDIVHHILSEYIMVCKFARSFATVFSVHFLNSFVFLILRTIFFTVAVIEVIKLKEYFVFATYTAYAGYLMFRLFIICFSCQNIHKEVTLKMIKIRLIIW